MIYKNKTLPELTILLFTIDEARLDCELDIRLNSKVRLAKSDIKMLERNRVEIVKEIQSRDIRRRKGKESND